MTPIPESDALLKELSEFYGADLLEELQQQVQAVRRLVPELVGVSVATLKDGIAVTLVATDRDVALLDAVQYIVGGPCVDGPPTEPVLYEGDRPDDENQWQAFSNATAAKSVATTLTLPVLDESEVVIGTVNLYAAVRGAFGGQHDKIAEIFDAWAPGAVTNADLAFRTRQVARDSLEHHRANMRIETAIGVLMSARSVDADTARGLLEEAAQRAGVTTDQLAETMLDAFDTPEGD